MDLNIVTEDRKTAREKFLAYRAEVRRSGNAEDAAIMRGYREVAKGNAVISLTAALRTGGRLPNGLPRLAVCRADATRCWLGSCWVDGRVRFVTKRARVWGTPEPSRGPNNRVDVRDFPKGTLPPMTVAQLPNPHGEELVAWNDREAFYAIVPSVPPEHRPGPHLRNYDILFEVDEWTRDPAPPVDPALLRHIGGDLYAVMAVWDLTELERLVIAGRA